MSKLKSVAIGVSWGTVSIVIVTLFQLFFMGVMARLLEPSDFGVMAIANVSLRFFSYFAQMGIAPALIQKASLDDNEIKCALTLSLGISGAFFILVLATAGIIDQIFAMQNLALVIQFLAINFIIVGFSSVSMGLIRRRRHFKHLAFVEIASYVFGYGVIGINAAYFGAGVWALVAAFISQTFLSAVLAYSVARHPIGLTISKEHRRHFIGYGGRYSIIGFIEFLTSNIDSLVIGKILGATAAGLYNRALLIANLPVQHPTRVLTQALFPVMSSISDQHDKQSISLQIGTLIVGCYAFAISAGISIAAPDIVLVLLGDKWTQSIPVLQILAWSIAPIYVANIHGVTLDSMALLTIKLHVQLTTLVLLVVMLYWFASSGSVIDIALVVVIDSWFRFIVMGAVLFHILKVPIRDLFQITLSIMLVMAISGMAVFAASNLMQSEVYIVSRLLVEIICGVIGLVTGLSLARYILVNNPAVIYLSRHTPEGFAKLLRV